MRRSIQLWLNNIPPRNSYFNALCRYKLPTLLPRVLSVGFTCLLLKEQYLQSICNHEFLVIPLLYIFVHSKNFRFQRSINSKSKRVTKTISIISVTDATLPLSDSCCQHMSFLHPPLCSELVSSHYWVKTTSHIRMHEL